MKAKPKLAATLSILSVAVIFFATYSFHAITAVAPVLETENSLPTIILDAGHGGFDGGAVGVDGVVEKDINLSIALKLHDMLKVNGFDVVLTRDTDKALNDSTAPTTRKKKSSDIHNRFEMAKSYENALLISIHQNKFTQSKYFGAQIFYGPKNPQSKMFAEIMQRRMIDMLQPENKRVYKACGDSVYLIYNAPMPALLVECGFISNPEDAHKLVTGEYQSRIAFTILAATAEYLGLEYQDLQTPPIDTSSEAN